MILKKSRFLIPVILVSILALFVFGACSKKGPMEPSAVDQPSGGEMVEPVKQPEPEPEQVVDIPPPPPPVKEEPVMMDKEPVGMVEEVPVKAGDVFFAFDAYDLSPEARSILANNADILNAIPGTKKGAVVIEGHCDERGTREYNLALGERRANSVKKYLVSMGVPSDRLKTISYGEDRPFAMGSNEAAWKQNRRAHFAIK